MKLLLASEIPEKARIFTTSIGLKVLVNLFYLQEIEDERTR